MFISFPLEVLYKNSFLKLRNSKYRNPYAWINKILFFALAIKTTSYVLSRSTWAIAFAAWIFINFTSVRGLFARSRWYCCVSSCRWYGDKWVSGAFVRFYLKFWHEVIVPSYFEMSWTKSRKLNNHNLYLRNTSKIHFIFGE